MLFTQNQGEIRGTPIFSRKEWREFPDDLNMLIKIIIVIFPFCLYSGNGSGMSTMRVTDKRFTYYT
jgi:hypothetical protein